MHTFYLMEECAGNSALFHHPLLTPVSEVKRYKNTAPLVDRTCLPETLLAASPPSVRMFQALQNSTEIPESQMLGCSSPCSPALQMSKYQVPVMYNTVSGPRRGLCPPG